MFYSRNVASIPSDGPCRKVVYAHALWQQATSRHLGSPCVVVALAISCRPMTESFGAFGCGAIFVRVSPCCPTTQAESKDKKVEILQELCNIIKNKRTRYQHVSAQCNHIGLASLHLYYVK